MRLQSYLYNIVYIPGKSNPADILSIKPLQINDKDTQLSDRTEAVINALISYNVPKTITLSEVLQASKTDNELTMVGKCVISGKWGKDDILKPYKLINNELTIKSGIIMKGDRIVIPEKLRSRILNIAHESHEGMTKAQCYVIKFGGLKSINKLRMPFVRAYHV